MKNDKLAHRFVSPVTDRNTPDATRRTEITIETHEIKTIRMRTVGGSTFCEQCGDIATSYGSEHVAVFLQISPDEVLRNIESGQIHQTRKDSGLDDVCGNSLRYLIRDRNVVSENDQPLAEMKAVKN